MCSFNNIFVAGCEHCAHLTIYLLQGVNIALTVVASITCALDSIYHERRDTVQTAVDMVLKESGESKTVDNSLVEKSEKPALEFTSDLWNKGLLRMRNEQRLQLRTPVASRRSLSLDSRRSIFQLSGASDILVDGLQRRKNA